ncbi:unnamed protein product [Arctia plantaginis]|uniref:Uncharacterized protein n=1 Tax=Arctia plantaginis TaxID=874455 RepID=A0A8S1ATN1_ARCPL|nr:unnamed protein product [Arctia plantaginis]
MSKERIQQHEKKCQKGIITRKKRTGGGPPPPKPSDTSEWLCSIMGESIVGLPSTHDSDFIFDNNTPQLNGEAAQPSVALSNIEEEMSMVSYTDGHNDGVIHDVAHIVPIHDVPENEETRETVKFDTSTPHTMLRKPLSKPLDRYLHLNCFQNIVILKYYEMMYNTGQDKLYGILHLVFLSGSVVTGE